MPNLKPWIPGSVLTVGCLFTLFINRQQVVPLASPLGTVTAEIGGYRGVDVPISQEEQKVVGFSSYLFRAYTQDSLTAFTVYVGYYDHQTQGKTIHSPKNCMPGAGWEALRQTVTTVSSAAGPIAVNRYLLQNGPQRVLVYYWYQGRGRVAANEYRVKWELLRDSAIHGRSEEALVRIVVPLTATRDEAGAAALATSVATVLIPEMYRVLPK